MQEIDYHDAERRVATAFVALAGQGDDPPGVEHDDIERLAASSGLPPGIVDEIVRDWGLEGTMGGSLVWTADDLRRIQAKASFRLVRPASATTHNNSVNVSGGTVQAAAGGNVSGTQNVTVTYGDVLTSLSSEIERSNMPAEKKSQVRKLLASAAEIVGPAILKAGVELAKQGVL